MSHSRHMPPLVAPTDGYAMIKSSLKTTIPWTQDDESKTLMSVSKQSCAFVSPNFQAAYPYSYDTRRSTKKDALLNAKSRITYSNQAEEEKPVSEPTIGNEQPQIRKTGAPSLSTKHRPDPNFIEFVPVKTEFRDRESLPKSMAALSPTDQMVNFYPVLKKGPNYSKYCLGLLSDEEKPPSITECVRKYTSGPNWYCTEINMALAAGSPRLSHYGPYIRHLKYSIGVSRMNFNGTVFRGTDMSPSEIAAYESKNIFFIPSFTSTSKTRPFQDKNTLIHIDITPEWSRFCMEIQPKHTNYPDEEEILFSCYNLYHYTRTEKSNGQRILKLRLMDYNRYFDYHRNIILDHDEE